ncbi:MAG: DUF1501 domain-containing protein [Planctomycetes bacterium]|nr:DUF1501 domain-containing protein [Planctomycetota bacterium]
MTVCSPAVCSPAVCRPAFRRQSARVTLFRRLKAVLRTLLVLSMTANQVTAHAFSIWLAGGGIRGGMTYGQTDEFGYYVTENKVTIPDFHATILHLLGLDHEQLTYRHGGRDHRLTDVHGHVLKEIRA